MQEYKGQDLAIAESVLSLLAKYKANGHRPDKSDLLYEARDHNNKVLLGNIEEVRFLEKDGYLLVSEREGFDKKPYYEFEITKDGEHWLRIAASGRFSKQLVRQTVLKELYDKEEEVSWRELVQALKRGDEPALTIVTHHQVLKAVQYLHQKNWVSFQPLSGDGEIIDFFTRISASGIDSIEGNPPASVGGFSVNIAHVSNSNLALNSAQAKQSIEKTQTDELLPKMERQIDELLSAIKNLELQLNGKQFEAYLSAALLAIDESPPDPNFAIASVSKALSVKEIEDTLESAKEATAEGARAWNAFNSLLATLKDFLG